MTKEEQQKRAESLDYIVLHKVTDTVIVRHKDGTEIYAVDVIRKPLVRCKKCKRNPWDIDRTDYTCVWNDDFADRPQTPCDYCSYGERREP